MNVQKKQEMQTDLHDIVRNVSFTPLCRCTSASLSEVILRVSDALLEPYGFTGSFYKNKPMFTFRPERPWALYFVKDFE